MLGTIEILALILSILILVKLLFMAFGPRSWLKFAKKFYKFPAVITIIYLVLIGVLFYLLLQSFTIVEIMAVVLLGALLTGIGFASFSKDIVSLADKMFKKGYLKKMLLPILLWLILAVWTILAILA